MPSRIIPESVLTDERICSLSPQAQLLIYKLVSRCDDMWRFDGRPSVVRSMCYPLDVDRVTTDDVARWMDEACRSGAMRVYHGGGMQVLQLLLFPSYSRGRAVTSKWPDPDPDDNPVTDATDERERLPAVTDGYQRLPYSDSDSYSDSYDSRERGGSAPHAPAAAHEEPAAVGAGARADTQPALPSTPSKPASGGPPRDTPDPPPVPEWALALARFIAARLLELNPRYRAPTAAGLRKWAVEIDRLHRLDGQPVEEIERVLRWSMADSFWGANIQSGKALRKHWNTITAQMSRGGSGNGTHRGGVARPGAAGQKAGMGYTALQRERQRELEAALGEGVGIQRVSPVEPAPPALVGEPQGGAATSPPAGGDAGACGMAG